MQRGQILRLTVRISLLRPCEGLTPFQLKIFDLDKALGQPRHAVLSHHAIPFLYFEGISTFRDRAENLSSTLAHGESFIPEWPELRLRRRRRHEGLWWCRSSDRGTVPVPRRGLGGFGNRLLAVLKQVLLSDINRLRPLKDVDANLRFLTRLRPRRFCRGFVRYC